MTGPITQAAPQQAVAPLALWMTEVNRFTAVVLLAARDAVRHLNQRVSNYLEMNTAGLDALTQACANTQTNLGLRLARLDETWQAVQQQGNVSPGDAALNQRVHQVYRSADAVLFALQMFFWSVNLDDASVHGLTRKAQDDVATQPGRPVSLALPDPWRAAPQQMTPNIMVREILISGVGMRVATNVIQADIDTFASLAG